MNIKMMSRWAAAIGFVAAAQLARVVKISMIFGSYTAFFSLNNSLIPLSGMLGFGTASLISIGKMILSMLLIGGLFPLHHLAFHLPGLFGTYYWASPSIIIRLFVPLVCMALFIVHPVGGQAWIYAMYWLIPVLLYVINKNNLFMVALGSTFIAHAVGSVIWLYTVPMTASVWYALMPMVIVERIIFALGMVLLYYIYHAIARRIIAPIFVRIARLA